MEGKQDVVWAKCGELYFAKSNEQVTEYLASDIMIIKLVPRVPLHNNLFCPKFKKVLGLILRSKTHSCNKTIQVYELGIRNNPLRSDSIAQLKEYTGTETPNNK